MFKTDIDFENLPENNFKPMPPGEYVAIAESVSRVRRIVGEEVDFTGLDTPEDSQDKIKVIYQILDNKYHGRKIFDYLSLWDEKETPRLIARRRFKDLCFVTNKKLPSEITDFSELCNGLLKITIKHSTQLNSQGEPYINVVAIKPLEQSPEAVSNTVEEFSRPF